MTAVAAPRVLLVDPSLFTAPYDAALTEGLVEAGFQPIWAARRLRDGESEELPRSCVVLTFYRHAEVVPASFCRLRAAAKGVSHLSGLIRLTVYVAITRPSLVHFQWALLPLMDSLVILLLRQICPVVLTVHDSVPFNGQSASWAQRAGAALPPRIVDRVIVHTQAARSMLASRSVETAKISVIPHGRLPIAAKHCRESLRQNRRWTLLLFGRIQPYKGLDVLIEALGRVSSVERAGLHVIVAGALHLDLTVHVARAAALGLEGTLDIRPGWLDAEAMAALLTAADAFVFPYRQVDASGVYCMIRPLGKWIIASRLGLFAEDMRDGVDGRLVDADDVGGWAAALAEAARHRPLPRRARPPPPEWRQIGAQTASLYRQVIAERRHRRDGSIWEPFP